MKAVISDTLLGFIGRVTIVHVITYFAFGLFFSTVLGYHEIYVDPEVAILMRPTSSIWVKAGPLFQLIRGPIFALVLFPFRKIFLERKRGWVFLWSLFLALAIFSPMGPSPGSIEGFVYTKLPVWFHIVGLPEVILQTLTFSWLVVTWEHRKDKKFTITLLVVFIMILILSILGVLFG